MSLTRNLVSESKNTASLETGQPGHSITNWKTKARPALFYALAIAICLLATAFVLDLRQADLSVPFEYTGDGLLSGASIKGVIDNGWYLTNNYVGAPYGQAMQDFPSADNLHFLVIKFISLFSSRYAVVMNLFFLATFPLTTISSLFVFRRLEVSFPAAIFGSLIFTFLPYHMLRGEGHLFLAAFYVIPLTALLIIRICSDRPPFIKKNAQGRAPIEFFSKRTAGYALIAAMTASAGIYYAFFACFFLVVAGIYAAYRNRSHLRLLSAGIALLLTVVIIIANLSPTLIYQLENGKNEEAAKRYPIESEMFGLTITQLLLPVKGHRLDFMNDARDALVKGLDARMSAALVMVNENDMASLGLIGSAGLLFSLGWTLIGARTFADRKKWDVSLLDTLGVLNITGIVFATMGGFGLIFALLATPEIRAYNRITPYIAFFSILTVLLVMERLSRRYLRRGKGPLIVSGALVVALFGGILDQSTPDMAPLYGPTAKTFASDEAFVKKIETVMPAGAMIYQLPYVAFPESDVINKMGNYQHFRAYLHSSQLLWSYGVIKGRSSDSWQKNLNDEQPSQVINDVVSAGFDGVYVVLAGYEDNGNYMAMQLENTLQEQPLTNGDHTLLFFDLREYARMRGHQ